VFFSLSFSVCIFFLFVCFEHDFYNNNNCMKNMIDTEYFINDGCVDHKVEKLTIIKDLGVIFDSELSF